MKRIIIAAAILFPLGFLVFGWSSDSRNRSLNDHPSLTKTETLWISDSSLQIIEYGEKGIESIFFIDDHYDAEKAVSRQKITFHQNGVMKEVYMDNGIRLLPQADGSGVYNYQRNLVQFSDKGVPLKGILMEGFNTVANYERKE